MRRPTILLADDQTVLVEGLKKLLEPDFEVVASVRDGRELAVAAARFKPDVVLLDISLPGLNGIDAALQLRRAWAGARVVFLTTHAEPTYVRSALAAGASGYVLKQCPSAELVAAIHQALQGGRYITPRVAKNTPASGLQPGKPAGELTLRERQVLRLIAGGNTAKEIAGILNISPKTATFHRSNITGKLGIHTTAGLTKYALRRGIGGE